MKASAEKIQERKRVMIMKKKEQNLDRFQFSTSCRNAIIQHEKHYTTTPAKDWNEAKHIFSQGTKYFNLGLQLFSFEEELVQRVRVNQLLSKLYKQLAAFKQEKIANNDALDRVSKIQWRRIKCLELSLGFCDPEANLIQVDIHRQTSLNVCPGPGAHLRAGRYLPRAPGAQAEEVRENRRQPRPQAAPENGNE